MNTTKANRDAKQAVAVLVALVVAIGLVMAIVSCGGDGGYQAAIDWAEPTIEKHYTEIEENVVDFGCVRSSDTAARCLVDHYAWGEGPVDPNYEPETTVYVITFDGTEDGAVLEEQ